MGEKDLPDDLRGHVFIIAPVGTIESGGLPFTNGDSFLSGDGMIYRNCSPQQCCGIANDVSDRRAIKL